MLFADALEDAAAADADADDEVDFEADEPPAEPEAEAEAEADVALEAEDALDPDEDAVDSGLVDNWLALVAAVAEPCDCAKLEASSAVDELAPLVRPWNTATKTATPIASAAITPKTIAATRPFDRSGTENDSGT